MKILKKGFIYLICSLCLLFILSSFVFGQREKSVILPESEAKAVTMQCSRKSPPKFTKTWQPTESDMKLMESKFSQIKRLKVKCCRGVKVSDFEGAYMQYIGIVVKNRKLIYINAFYDYNPGSYWKEHAQIICDGGSAWGVLYDSETGKFFDLAINGIA
jgi:hypothetical protein